MRSLLVIGAAALFFSCGGGTSEKEAPKKMKFKKEKAKTDVGLLKKAKAFFQPLPEIAVSANNELTPEKIALGKKLYYDKRLSKDGTISCNSCHDLNKYGVDNLPTSPGDEGKNGDRNSPTVLNAALHFRQFWDGRAADVEEQAGMPILNPVEMNIPSEEFLVKRLNGIAEYKAAFKKAFPKDGLTYKNMELAIGAFERTLLTPSKFDAFLKGDESALSAEETKGLELFINTGCITCHIGPAIGGSIYQKFALYGNYWDYTKSANIDEGRFKETGNESDKFMFKVPSLRNIEKTYPYFHDGSINSLEEAVIIMAKTENNKDLSTEDAKSIVTFLNTLTGEVPKEAL